MDSNQTDTDCERLLVFERQVLIISWLCEHKDEHRFYDDLLKENCDFAALCNMPLDAGFLLPISSSFHNSPLLTNIEKPCTPKSEVQFIYNTFINGKIRVYN